MSKDCSININDFTGIFRKIAEKADINEDQTLSGAEISLFNDIKSTHNTKHKTFLFDNKYYDEKGNEINDLCFKDIQNPVSTKVYRMESITDIQASSKNNRAIEKAKKYGMQTEKNLNKNIVVKKVINGREVNFSYNRASIEEHIIKNSYDSKGNKITIFSDIPDIRKKPYRLRTKEECKKLVEFNNMVNNAINAGTEYGVDPKLIIAIMQREVGYDGLSSNVVGANGKGYMQLTSAPIKDMLGGYTKNKKLYYEDEIKTEQYGPEIKKLLKSRGFDTNCPPEKRQELVDRIMAYLKTNKDSDFNIRLGTLVLRYYLNKYDGNIQLAAQNYNGNSRHGIKYAYGKAVNNFYNIMNS